MPTISIDSTRHPAYPEGHPGGPCAAGYGVYYDGDLIGTIDLDDGNNWCAFPLDKAPLLYPQHILKDEWDAEKVMHLVRTGLSQSRLSYRSKYESSVDLLRGRQDIYSWLAGTLSLFAPANEIDRPDRRLADFLNKLLDGLHPLLPLAGAAGMQLDPARRIATVQFWSKALGSPISMCMSRTRGYDCETGASLGFNRAERVLEEPALGLVATIATPDVPPFDSFAC
jgi:hypothetical protein